MTQKIIKVLWTVLCLCVEVRSCQEKGKGTWHKAILSSLGKMSFACKTSAKPSLKGKNKTNFRLCARAMMQKRHISFYKLQWGILSESCKPPFRSHKHGDLPSALLRRSCLRGKIHQNRMQANIKPQVKHKYIDTAGKEISFPSWKWFPCFSDQKLCHFGACSAWETKPTNQTCPSPYI